MPNLYMAGFVGTFPWLSKLVWRRAICVALAALVGLASATPALAEKGSLRERLTPDVMAAPGYSVTPFDVIAGVDLGGRITGAKVVFHREPYIYHDAVRQPLLDTFLAREAGMPLRGGATMLPPDFVA